MMNRRIASIEEVRAKMAKSEKKTESKFSDNAVYPFWNIPEGETSVLRLLPDGDETNDYCWVERLMIRLPFQGIKGEHSKEVVVQVPCMEMYKETCPVLTAIRPWWKDNSLQDRARVYWKKKSYVMQGFVVKDGLGEENTPENPIRRFPVNPSVFEKIKAALMNPDMDNVPWDFTGGRDFRLIKTSKGGYANYDTSTWSLKVRSLDAKEQAAIEQYGLWNLSEYLPQKPTPEAVNAIKEMFEASRDNEEYDPDRWARFFKPSGYTASGGDTANEGTAKVVAAAVDDVVDDEPPVRSAPASAPAGKASASDILAKIKANATKK